MVPVLPFEQRKLIPIYRRKWRKISYCSETAELAKIEQLIKKAYKMVQRSEPKIILTTNPGRALMTLDKTGFSPSNILDKVDDAVENVIFQELEKIVLSQALGHLQERDPNSIKTKIYLYLRQELVEHRWSEPLRAIHLATRKTPNHFYNQLKPDFRNDYSCIFSKFIETEYWLQFGTILDFYISVLGCSVDKKVWSLFKSLLKFCGWILPLEDICIVVSRPKIILNEDAQLHAEKIKAVKYPDGYGFYFYKNTQIPSKYGRKSPSEWHYSFLAKMYNIM